MFIEVSTKRKFLVTLVCGAILLTASLSVAAEKNDKELLKPALPKALEICHDIEDESTNSCNVPVKFDLACAGGEHVTDFGEKGLKLFTLCVSRNKNAPWTFSIFTDEVDTEVGQPNKAPGMNMLDQYTHDPYNHRSQGIDHCQNLTASAKPQTSSDGRTNFEFAYKAWYSEDPIPDITYRVRHNFKATFEKDFNSGIVRRHQVLPWFDIEAAKYHQNTILCTELKSNEVSTAVPAATSTVLEK